MHTNRPTWLINSIILFSLLGHRDAWAAPVTLEQAGDVVRGWLNADQRPLETPLGVSIGRVEGFKDKTGATIYYVVYLEPTGFVIVAADDLIEPIIGFVPDGRYDPSPDNPLGALVSSDLADRNARVGKTAGRHGSAVTPTQAKWETLLWMKESGPVPLGLTSISDVRVSPLLSSTWDQDLVNGNACYNYYTPPGASGAAGNYVCGCVATAMAQLMRYWQYPVNSVGTASFTITVDGASQSRSLRGGNGAGGPYDWANMPLSPGSSTTLAQRQAIGALCADAGVTVGMDYTSDSSASDTLDAKTAFTTTFHYANAIKGYNSGSTIGAALNAMVNPNLDARMPVLLGITGSDGGHAIVCDGYGYNVSTLYHHLNLGWSGSATAWYNLPTIDAGSYTFNSVYKCVYNVWTNGTGEIISGRVADGGGSAITGVVVSAVRSGGGTYTATTDVRGVYALAKIPASSAYTLSASKAGLSFTNQSAATGSSVDNASSAGNRWSVNFTLSDTNDPASFTAVAISTSRIDLAWTKNAAGDNVMVAWNSSATFGTPSGSYTVGGSISGGGTVLYNGSATALTHSNRTAGTPYFYRAWSVRSGPTYSAGKSCSESTPRGVPFAEGFENAGTIPSGWTQESVSGALDWTFQAGGGRGDHPASAHSGSYNALLYYAGYTPQKTKLVTPKIDFGSSTANAQLKFWHYMEEWPSDQDELRIYYRTSATGAWVFVEGYSNSVAAWTQRTIALPNPNSSYYIAFEGNAKYGYGVCVDDVSVTGTTAVLPTVTLSAFGTNMVEASGSCLVTAKLSAASAQAVTVNLSFSGTATPTTDYTRSATSIVIAAGSTSGAIMLTAVQDTAVEGNETIVVDIATVQNGTESGTQRVTATILDDDPALTVTSASNDFGQVCIRSTNAISFMVKNTGYGTLAGTASVSSPFSVYSGSPYSLAAGVSNYVVVRYLPTTAGNHSNTVAFTGGSGTNRPLVGQAFSDLVDTDGDGLCDWSEVVAGTSISNANSAFEFLFPTNGFRPASGTGVILQWPSATNRFYNLYRSTNLLTGFNMTVVTNLSATPPMNTYTDTTSSANAPNLYRIRVERR